MGKRKKFNKPEELHLYNILHTRTVEFGKEGKKRKNILHFLKRNSFGFS